MMTTKIVTDSSCDLPQEVAKELDITIVPLYVQVGEKTYRDGIDISPEQIYNDMYSNDSVVPTTAAASPHDFAETYSKICHDYENIISIHVSGKLSSTLNAARQGREMAAKINCRIEVIDSKLATIALGLVAVAAAKAARAGQSMQNILDNVSHTIPAIRVLGMLDTLKYALRGGRLGKAGPLLSSVLPVKPIITIRDGLVSPVGVVRTRGKGMERLFDMVSSAVNIKEIGIAHSVMEGEVRSIVDKLKSIVPNVIPTVANLGPVVGVHGGPGSILMAFRQEISDQLDTMKKPLVSLPSLHSIKEGLTHHIQKDTIRPAEFATGTL